MTTDPLDTVIAALDQRQCRPRPTRNGWSARCPAHEDHNPSLSIGVGDNKQVLMKCHRGCSIESICKALGMTAAELWPKDTQRPQKHTSQRHDGNGRVYPTLEAALDAWKHKYGKPEAVWKYHNASGAVVGAVVRWNRPEGQKIIRPFARRPTGWVCGAMPEPRPMYGLPEVMRADPSVPVVVVEGEKVADAAVRCGLVATTSAGGAKAAAKTDWTPLAGRRVLILPDHDEAGDMYAEAVTRLALAAGACDVRVLRLAEYAPELPEGGDLADVLEAANWLGLSLGNAVEPAGLGRWILDKANAIEPRRPDPDKETSPTIVRIDDVHPEPIKWLWPGRIPLGRLTLIAGMPGVGKSFVTLDMASRITTGTPWPDGEPCERGDVLILSAEDDPADTIRPRLDAMFADTKRAYLLTGVCRNECGKHYQSAITLHDVDSISQAIARLSYCRLVIVDPVGAFMGSQTDGNAENQVRAVLQPLAELARKHGCAVALVAHRRKMKADSADDYVLGSRAYVGLARAVWHVTRDPGDQSKIRRLFLPGKMNLAADVSGLAFSILSDPARVIWEREPVAMTADDALAAEADSRRRGPEARLQTEAEELLRQALVDGPRPAKDVEDELYAKGVAGRTLSRARKAIGVIAFRKVHRGPWWWRLPGGLDCQDMPLDYETWQPKQVMATRRTEAHVDGVRPLECQVSDTGGKLGSLRPDSAARDGSTDHSRGANNDDNWLL